MKWLGLVFAIVWGAAAQAEVISFEEENFFLYESTEPAEQALLIYPGAGVSADRYQALAETIVTQAKRPTSVLVAKFFANLGIPPFTGRRIEQAQQLLNERYLSSPQLYLAGHSDGGVFGSRAAKTKKLGGLILLGSYLPATPGFSEDYQSYPLPVMSIFGDLDGLTGINFAAREYEKMLSYEAKFGEDFRREVAIVSGVNHMQFADGKFLAGDLDAQVSLEQAHERIANLVIAFMQADSPESQSVLKGAKEESRKLISTLIEAKASDASMCQRAQRMSAQLADWSAIRIEESKYASKAAYPKFIIDKSYLETTSDGYLLGISSYQENVLNLTDVSSGQYLSPEVIGCKLRSQQAILDFTGLESLAAQKTCAELNAYELDQAWNSLSEIQKARFERLLGKKLSLKDVSLTSGAKKSLLENDSVLIEDNYNSRGDQWALGSFPKLSLEEFRIKISTYSITTSDAAIGNFVGAFYCKLLPRERLVEWLILFAAKSN